ncbi:MAG: ferritin family protein [Oscillospiraceae bacterium]|jgi:rubrerythrin
MDEKYDFLRGLENFEKVWQRVTGEKAASQQEPGEKPCPQRKCSDVERLRLFMDGENKAIAFYSDLARKCRGWTREMLMNILVDERSHLKKLQLEYFLLTGDSYAPPKVRPSVSGILSSLRLAYLDERKANKGYMEAAKETENQDLAALFNEIAADEAKHEEKLRCMIEQSLSE